MSKNLNLLIGASVIEIGDSTLEICKEVAAKAVGASSFSSADFVDISFAVDRGIYTKNFAAAFLSKNATIQGTMKKDGDYPFKTVATASALPTVQQPPAPHRNTAPVLPPIYTISEEGCRSVYFAEAKFAAPGGEKNL